MNPQNATSPLPPLELPPSMLPVVPAAAEGSAKSTGSDYLYQIAALAAGAFLLATLL
jgi:hypothetical protein